MSIVEKTAERDKLSVILLCDTKHVLHLDYSEEIIIGVGYIKMFHAILKNGTDGNERYGRDKLI